MQNNESTAWTSHFYHTPLKSTASSNDKAPSLMSVTYKDCFDTDIRAIKFNSLSSKGKNVQKTQLSLSSAGILRDKFSIEQVPGAKGHSTRLTLREGKFCREGFFFFWHHREVFRTWCETFPFTHPLHISTVWRHHILANGCPVLVVIVMEMLGNSGNADTFPGICDVELSWVLWAKLCGTWIWPSND